MWRALQKDPGELKATESWFLNVFATQQTTKSKQTFINVPVNSKFRDAGLAFFWNHMNSAECFCCWHVQPLFYIQSSSCWHCIRFNLPFVPSRATISDSWSRTAALSTVTCDKYAAFPNQKQLSSTKPGVLKKAAQLQHQQEQNNTIVVFYLLARIRLKKNMLYLKNRWSGYKEIIISLPRIRLCACRVNKPISHPANTRGQQSNAAADASSNPLKNPEEVLDSPAAARNGLLAWAQHWK